VKKRKNLRTTKTEKSRKRKGLQREKMLTGDEKKRGDPGEKKKLETGKGVGRGGRSERRKKKKGGEPKGQQEILGPEELSPYAGERSTKKKAGSPLGRRYIVKHGPKKKVREGRKKTKKVKGFLKKKNRELKKTTSEKVANERTK